MKQFAFYFGIIMISIYLLMGLAFMFTNVFATVLGTNKFYIGLALVIYSIFRLWMTFRLFRSKKVE